MSKPLRIRTLWRFGALTVALSSLTTARAQLSEAKMRELEPKLPPPATTEVDFDRHIRPILENTCIRCHGPERPKSRFRLDSKESALKGGESGIDIVQGNSARSPL